MSSLNELLVLSRTIEEELLNNNGEITKDIQDMIEKVSTELPYKVDAYSYTLDHLQSVMSFYKEKSKSLTKMARACESIINALREKIKHTMIYLEANEIAGMESRFKLRDLEIGVEIDEIFLSNEWKKGQVLVQDGEYIGDSPNQYGKDNHNFKERDGTIVCLNASGQLDFILSEQVSKGDRCRITFAGKTIIEKGKFQGKEANSFEVRVKRAERHEEEIDEVGVEEEEETQETSSEVESEEAYDEDDMDLEDLES